MIETQKVKVLIANLGFSPKAFVTLLEEGVNSADVVRELAVLLADKNDEIRQNAALLLVILGRYRDMSEVIPALLEACADEDTITATYAKLAAGYYCEQTGQELMSETEEEFYERV